MRSQHRRGGFGRTAPWSSAGETPRWKDEEDKQIAGVGLISKQASAPPLVRPTGARKPWRVLT